MANTRAVAKTRSRKPRQLPIPPEAYEEVGYGEACDEG